MKHLRLAHLACACAAASVSGSTYAAVPMIDSVAIANPHSPANTMMYQVTVQVRDYAPDADHTASVGFAPRGTACATGTWNIGLEQQFDTTNTRSWILYNFQPGTRYDYKVQVGSGSTARTRCGALGTPRLPTNLAALNPQFSKGAYETKYVLVDTVDCGSSTTGTASRSYLIGLDTDTENIVWYLDVAAMSSLGGKVSKGWRYHPPSASEPARILEVVDKRYLYAWNFDGTSIAAVDLAPAGECDGIDAYGPCLNHDAYYSELSGNTYAVASRQSSLDGTGTAWDVCGTSSLFLDDGFLVLDEDFAVADERYMMTDLGYEPDVDGGPWASTATASSCDIDTWADYFGPYGSIDWTHVNAIVASSFGGSEVLDLSVKDFDQILRVDPSGARIWALSPHAPYSDWGPIRRVRGVVGPLTFADQHDAHPVSAEDILMLDNRGDAAGARAIRIHLDDGPPVRATMDASWAVVDADGNRLRCDLEGAAQEVPGTGGDRVLATCSESHTIVELSDSTGQEQVPPLAIWLEDATGSTRFCTAGGPASVDLMRGFYRAFPVEAMGEH
jgi:hypothetical protein